MYESEFQANSRYGGPIQASIDPEGIEITVGEGYDDYAWTYLDWDKAQEFSDWLIDILNKKAFDN